MTGYELSVVNGAGGGVGTARLVLSDSFLGPFVFRGEDGPFLQVQGGQFSYEGFMTCFRGSSESPFCMRRSLLSFKQSIFWSSMA